jgi:hypothetical protein
MEIKGGDVGVGLHRTWSVRPSPLTPHPNQGHTYFVGLLAPVASAYKRCTGNQVHVANELLRLGLILGRRKWRDAPLPLSMAGDHDLSVGDAGRRP